MLFRISNCIATTSGEKCSSEGGGSTGGGGDGVGDAGASWYTPEVGSLHCDIVIGLSQQPMVLHEQRPGLVASAAPVYTMTATSGYEELRCAVQNVTHASGVLGLT